jgi:hypothetical protein
MRDVALVRCDGVKQVVENGDPCTVLCARLVVPVNSSDPGFGGEYQAVEWVNQPDDELPKLPRSGATVYLVPHPDRATQTLVVGDCRVYRVWAGPVLFLFCLYDAGFDASGYLGRIFSVREA